MANPAQLPSPLSFFRQPHYCTHLGPLCLGARFPRCDCDDFCAGKCSRNPDKTAGAANVTLYRMTMQGVMELSNKNTGGVRGEMSMSENRGSTPNRRGGAPLYRATDF